MFKRLLILMTALSMIFAMAIPAFGEEMAESGRNSIILDSGEFIAEESPDPEQSARNLEEAVALGILSEEMAKRPNDPAMEKDIPGMLQPAFVHGYGHESAYLQQMANCAEEGRIASRFWFAMGIYYPYCEVYFSKTVDDAWAFMDEMDRNPPVFPFASFESCGYGIIRSNSITNNPEMEGIISSGTVWDLCTDADVIFKGYEWGLTGKHDFGDVYAPQVAYALYDRRSGEKVLDICEDLQWHPERKMSIRQAAEAALRYWHFFEEPAVKMAFADVGTYDTSIITDELLHKETTLPANSCKHLPAEWHGILWTKWYWVTAGALGYNFDRVYRPEDVQVLKDAGLNLARLNLSFSWLQTPDVTAGLVNETRLKQMDELLALCMQNDIHLMIAGNQYQDVSEWADFNEESERASAGPKTDKEIQDFAACWQMLARRYAAIPNEYLSFNLYNEICIDNEEEYERVLGPAVDAIRAESPDRTIIADVHTPGLTGKSMAKRGVALSYHLYDPMGFVYINELGPEKMSDPDYMHSVTWPYTENGKTYDAAALLDMKLHDAPNAASINSLRAMAEKNDVGFMVGEFGVFGELKGGMATVRYTDEALFGYYRDIIETFEKEGIGWIVGPIAGTWGLQAPYPAVEGVQYEKVGLYYVDTGFRDLLKSFEK